MPIPPPAPALFSTTIFWPSDFSIATAVGRPVRSATPPGGNGTIIVIGLAGNGSCANAALHNDSNSAAHAARAPLDMTNIIGSPPEFDGTTGVHYPLAPCPRPDLH